jgi:bifunctional DNA-binding transcriptional regulator/antitoxin component of YhaV-PrlF toxin-antitoxin module
MPSYRAKVGAGGAVVLPPELRTALDVCEGVEVEFFLTLDGDVFFHAITAQAKGWGDLHPVVSQNPPISIREMDAGIAEAIVEDYDRIMRQTASESRSAAE